ncbi:Scr1 family TA system antitoxin-like transcriptional regulator [Embleya sp. NBC_00896]|uniref:helix-turn-helix domain-containing protein n=1 Tax=Embleya sp. NBC_00896 TaxID=2975961 RepID=UPI00386A58BF|nr:DUF5753 domain-containing protein [Embleya sp. NBC_00896]
MTDRPSPGNATFVAARYARGWNTQQQLADAFEHQARELGLRIDVSVRQVRRWESTAPPWPTPDYQSVLEAMFGQSLSALGFVPPYGNGVQSETVHGVRADRHGGWWRAVVDDLPNHLERLVAMESIATGVRSYQTTLIPGVLQTYEYACAAIRATGPSLSDEAVHQRAELRMERQRRFRPTPGHPAWFIIDESALRRSLGNRSVLLDQLAHLLQEASRRPELRIQVLQVDAETAIPQPFVIYQLPEPSRCVVYLEAVGDAMYADSVEIVAGYSIAYESLQAAALPPARSLEFISRRLANLWDPETEVRTSWGGESPATPATADAWRWRPGPPA